MNARNFYEYIDNPSQLYQISYQELKSLVLQYPYCQSLRYLLLQKSKMENHKDVQRNLEMASTYSIDRNFLFNLMQEMESQPTAEDNYLISDEVLELKDLTRLEEDMELIEVGEKEIEELRQFTFDNDIINEDLSDDIDDLTDIEESEYFLENLLNAEDPLLANAASDEPFITNLEELSPTSDVPTTIEGDLAPVDIAIPSEPVQSSEEIIEVDNASKLLDEDLINNLASFSEVIDYLDFQKDREVTESASIPLEITNQEDQVYGSDLSTEEPTPQPKSSFNSWLQQFEAPLLEGRLIELSEISKKAKEKRKKKALELKKREEEAIKREQAQDNIKKKASQLAKESVREDDEILSEPLAMILESQGHIDKAIDMYERLSLQNPEKSSSFAAKIEELKTQL